MQALRQGTEARWSVPEELTVAFMSVNDRVQSLLQYDQIPQGLPGHRICFDASMITILLRGESEKRFKAVVLPVSWQELQDARTEFAGWVATKDTGPLSGSFGALMDWWIRDHRPGWRRRFDVIDTIHLKYAVAVSDKNVRFVGGD